MADKQSRGLDEGLTKASESIRSVGEATSKAGRKIGELTVKIDVDVSEALTGLKAVTREAKAATKALRELETYYGEEGKRYYVKWRQQGDECTDIREVCMSDIPTAYLSRELAKRDGVKEYVIDPHENRAVIEFFGEVGSMKLDVDGPAVIIVNRD